MAPTASPNARPASVRAEWWKHFASPQLDRLMGQALADSLTLQAAAARVQQAEGQARIAGAPLVPALSLSGAAQYSSQTASRSSRNVLAQASYELDFWGKNRNAAASARALAAASSFDADTVAMTLSASVANGYFTLLSLDERISLAREAAQAARRQLDLIVTQRRLGTATELQAHQQETALATYLAAVPALMQQRAAALHALAVLCGQAPEQFAPVDSETLATITQPAIRPDMPAELLALRPDIQAAEARLRSANFDIGVARAAFFPSLSLSASGGLDAASTSRLFPPAALGTLGGSLLAPLFQGGALSGQLKVDRARKLELVATYRQTVLTAYQDVEDMLSALGQLRDQEALQATAVKAARQAAALAQQQYRLGGADELTVLTTQQSLYQAQDSLAQIHLQQLEASVGLCRALGGGFGMAGVPPHTLPLSDGTHP